MPMYTLSIIKSKALKGGQVAADVRSLYIRSIRSMSFPQIMMNLYPRMFGVHDLPEPVGYLGNNDRLELPRYMRISYSYMVADGAYMLSKSDAGLRYGLPSHLAFAVNGEVAMLWLGHAVSPQIINDLYAVENLEELDIRIVGSKCARVIMSADFAAADAITKVAELPLHSASQPAGSS